MAMVMPAFLLFLFAIIEFGHAMMVRAVLQAAARDGARIGSVGDMTTAGVLAYVDQRLASALDAGAATVAVRDAGAFDNPEKVAAGIDLDNLPTIELADAESRQLYIVRISIAYEDVAILPPFWTTGLQIQADSVIRHE
jgi:hypothetical protein